MTSRRPSPLELARFIWRHPANRDHRAAALARAVRWQLDKRLRGARATVRLPGGAVLEVTPDSTSASLALYTAGLPDYHEMQLALRYLQPGDLVVDVGANVGVWTLLLAAAVRPGRVLAFEPGAQAREQLRHNLRRNDLEPVVEVRAEVLSDRAGTIDFVEGSDTTNRIAAAGESLSAHETTARHSATTLDAACAGRVPALLKVDVEGAEPRVLAGAPGLLAAERPPLWIVEWSSAMTRHGAPPWRWFRWLRERGWCVATFDADAHRGRGALRVFDRWDAALEPGQGAPRNVVLVAERALADIHARLR